VIGRLYWECPDCEFDLMFLEEKAASDLVLCPECLNDSGHLVVMRARPATEADTPEGLAR
jgi:hypothetical protein